jgi:hypothetical protein
MRTLGHRSALSSLLLSFADPPLDYEINNIAGLTRGNERNDGDFASTTLYSHFHPSSTIKVKGAAQSYVLAAFDPPQATLS